MGRRIEDFVVTFSTDMFDSIPISVAGDFKLERRLRAHGYEMSTCIKQK